MRHLRPFVIPPSLRRSPMAAILSNGSVVPICPPTQSRRTGFRHDRGTMTPHLMWISLIAAVVTCGHRA